MTNPALQDILTMLREGPLSLSAPPEESRAIFDAMFAEVPRPEGVHYEPGSVAGVDGLWVKPDNAPAGKAILYAHGGGYVIGSPDTYASTIGHLASFTGLYVFAPNYRKAPEHPYPAGPDDMLAAYLGLLEAGYAEVVVGGDSAGGGLTMSLLLSCAEMGIDMPAGAVLWSPWLNLACDTESHAFNEAHDPTLDAAGLHASRFHYVGEDIPEHDILNPLTADLSGLPPLLIQVGSIEILLDDATELAAEAGAAGVRVQLDIYPGMPHVFQSFHPALEASTQALQGTADFVKRCLGH